MSSRVIGMQKPVCTKLVLIPLQKLQNQLCAVPKPAAPKPALCLLLNRLCIGTKPAFSFWINISTVSEVRFDCQGLGLVARNEASILVFDTKPVLYRPVLDQIQFCNFDRGCKTCLETKPVLDQGRFCSLTYVFVLLNTSRVIGTETCMLDRVFPPGELWFDSNTERELRCFKKLRLISPIC